MGHEKQGFLGNLGEPDSHGAARALFGGLSLRVRVVDIILHLTESHIVFPGARLPDFQNNDEGGVGPYHAKVQKL